MAKARAVYLLLFLGCGPDEGLVIGESGSPIIYGYAPDEWWHDATVSLHGRVLKKGVATVSASPFCSGTLVAPNVVLTAGHCLSGRTTTNTFVSFHDAPLTAGSAFSPLAASALSVHPQYNGSSLVNDIALLRLAQPVSVAPVAPLPSGGLDAAPSVTLASDASGLVRTNFAGFGYSVLSSRRGRVTKSGLGTLLQFDDVIEGVGCHIVGCPNPSDTSIDATQFAYTQGDGGPCNGDSGGPAFVFEGDPNNPSAVYVAGITSYGDANCNIYGVSTRVDGFAAFITSFVGP